MNETNNSYTQDNSDYVNATIMQLRLDSKEVLDRLRLFLEGVRYSIEVDAEGNQVNKREQFTAPKCNKEGVNSLMSFLETKVNPQVVQGFFASDRNGYSIQYVDYICDVHESILQTIMMNMAAWEIKDEDMGLIIDTFMQMIEPFMTRLIGDGERNSYAQTMKVNENNTVKESGGFNLFSKQK